MTILINTPFKNLGDLHHELRTPLTGLQALTLIDDKNLNEEQRSLLAVARESAQRMLNTINLVLSSPIKEIKSYNGPKMFTANKQKIVFAINNDPAATAEKKKIMRA